MSEPRKILLIDDDPEVLSAMRLLLERHGYAVTTASDGEAGLHAAQREKPHLVVVDMMMPKKSGFIVLENLKNKGEESPKVIMITANEGGRHRAYAEMLGVDEYLRKPFSGDKLIEAVNRVLNPQPPD